MAGDRGDARTGLWSQNHKRGAEIGRAKPGYCRCRSHAHRGALNTVDIDSQQASATWREWRSSSRGAAGNHRDQPTGRQAGIATACRQC
jgi:hypothetical protein